MEESGYVGADCTQASGGGNSGITIEGDWCAQIGPEYFRPVDQPLHPHLFQPSIHLLSEPLPQVLVTPQAYKKICLYVEIAKQEVGWLGTVSRMTSGDFLIDDTFLVEQEVSGIETQLSKLGQAKLLMELSGKGDEGLSQIERLRFWGHSHVHMQPFPSWTDECTMSQFAHLDWFVRGIFNKQGMAKFDIYLNHLGYRIWDASWAVWDPLSGEEISLAGGSEVVTRPVPATATTKRPQTGGILSSLANGVRQLFCPSPAPAATAAGTTPTVDPSDTTARATASATTGADNAASGKPAVSVAAPTAAGVAPVYPAQADCKADEVAVIPASTDPKTGQASGATVTPTLAPAAEPVLRLVLPGLLLPSQDLRDQIKAEFQAKVKEHRPSRWRMYVPGRKARESNHQLPGHMQLPGKFEPVEPAHDGPPVDLNRKQ